jgi:hypothetical protein
MASATGVWSDMVKATGASVETLAREDLGIRTPQDLKTLARVTDLLQLRELFERKLTAVQLAYIKAAALGAHTRRPGLQRTRSEHLTHLTEEEKAAHEDSKLDDAVTPSVVAGADALRKWAELPPRSEHVSFWDVVSILCNPIFKGVYARALGSQPYPFGASSTADV